MWMRERIEESELEPKTVPVDLRFQSQADQSRYCWFLYNEFLRCNKDKGTDCIQYRAGARHMCPNQWLAGFAAERGPNWFGYKGEGNSEEEAWDKKDIQASHLEHLRAEWAKEEAEDAEKPQKAATKKPASKAKAAEPAPEEAAEEKARDAAAVKVAAKLAPKKEAAPTKPAAKPAANEDESDDDEEDDEEDD